MEEGDEMWKKWKGKLKGFFNSDEYDAVEKTEQEQQDIEVPTQGKQHIQARVTYQYPKKPSLHIPVQQASKKRENKDDIPAFQRKKDNQRSRSNIDSNQKQMESNDQDKTIIRKESKRPFKASEVPSPIYGYHKRNTVKEIENVPAFVRNEPQVEKEKEPIKVAKSEPIIEEKVMKKEEVIVEELSTQVRPEPQEKVIPVEEPKDVEKAPKKAPKEHDIKASRRKKHTPFNVMMTPRDKKALLDKEKAIRAEAEKRRERDLATLPQKLHKKIPTHLLNDPITSSNEDRLWVQEQQELLERTLKHFNVQAKVVRATQGPSVTRFEVHPEFGVRVSKIRNLSDDIKLNMAAKDIRIEAPIPGKNTVGIEVPNLKAQMVGLQEIFQTDAFQKSESPLTIGLGLSVEGLPLITNISKMPHGLIAGATGSGKSVCINTILISLLYKSSHEDVKFLLIDPKMVELAPYNGVPHLLAPVITDVKAATAALKWAVGEMEDRYDKFVREGVRDIERYNEKMLKQNRLDEKMPFMVIVIDELADLMMVSPQDVEDAICRIAQKARACGMHLLLATQRPSVDVITGLIKANIPTRIAFSVSSQVDSRTIIDTGGAERLLGRGDMLFIENGSRKNVRLQGAFVSDEEIERITNYARSIADPVYLFEQDELLQQMEIDEEVDELFTEALQFVVEQGRASTSLLQRQFRIGYNRAARLIDTLEDNGVISGQNGSKPREVLLSLSQISELL